MLTTAWREHGDDRVEVTVAEALENRDDTYRCLACGERVFPHPAPDGGDARPHFAHEAGAATCRRNPRRPDRRKAMRPGGRRAED